MGIKIDKPDWKRDESGRYYKPASYQSKSNYRAVVPEDHNIKYVAEKFSLDKKIVIAAYGIHDGLHNLSDESQEVILDKAKNVLLIDLGEKFLAATTLQQLKALKADYGDNLSQEAWSLLSGENKEKIWRVAQGEGRDP